MDFTADLMWDGASRDHEAETLELARTAALNDADKLVGPLVFQAANDVDLGHRLALAEPHLNAISSFRGYPVADLEEDLKRRWALLAESRAGQAKQAAVTRQVTAAQEQFMDQAVSRLAAMAAKDNPLVPMRECLRLATEAVQKHADAFPLAYESWGGTADGPITDRAKHWKPPGMKGAGGGAGAVDPGANGGASTFDNVHQRLDDMENRLGGGSPSGPSGPVSPTASLDAMAAGFMDRVKNWWSGNGSQPHTPAPSATPAPAPAAGGRAPLIAPSNNAASDHVDDAVTRHHDEQGRREFDNIMRRLDGDQAEMNHKWDTPRADRFESPADTEQRTQHLQNAHDRRTTDMEGRVDRLSDSLTPSAPSTPAGGFSHTDRSQVTNVPLHNAGPASFSHPDTGSGAGVGQQQLPTDPAPSFSHSQSHTSPRPQDHAFGGHFQYGA
ncbi:hypothetical protein QFZ75_008064 [Streptomyces sp. V3I8]|uniref:hypothetical protein n=1 Tax=Streptomyces sp. V3I8 TaxID=3042279 RepID=UPI00277D459D|nr:hypothetical protein [Streptomyces sp. V3I8]MDQ1041562.1 hypothetical protein [Streptomyces sp. V3I8]